MTQKLISNSKRDRLINKCESLVLQGIESPTEISDTLNISYNTAKTYIAIVRERWASDLDTEDLQEKRRDLIRKTEEIVRESWNLRKSSKNTLEAVGALRTALMAIERLEKLQGIDSLPFPSVKTTETQIFDFAQEINSVSQKEKDGLLKVIKTKINEKSTRVGSELVVIE